MIAGSPRAVPAFALLAALAAPAPVPAAGSNLPGGYPQAQCGGAPEVPPRPAAFADEAAIEAYNREVAHYNDAMDRFVRCIQTYVDNASEDIRRIREMSRRAIDSARE